MTLNMLKFCIACGNSIKRTDKNRDHYNNLKSCSDKCLHIVRSENAIRTFTKWHKPSPYILSFLKEEFKSKTAIGRTYNVPVKVVDTWYKK